MTNHASTDGYEDGDQSSVALSTLANPRRVRWASLQQAASQDS